MNSYLFTIGQTFNPSSVNNLKLRELALTLSNNGSNSLDLRASDAGLAPVVQIQVYFQENEMMQVASLCNTVKAALAGSGHISQMMMLLFELEQDIEQQA